MRERERDPIRINTMRLERQRINLFLDHCGSDGAKLEQASIKANGRYIRVNNLSKIDRGPRRTQIGCRNIRNIKSPERGREREKDM